MMQYILHSLCNELPLSIFTVFIVCPCRLKVKKGLNLEHCFLEAYQASPVCPSGRVTCG